MNPRRNDLFRKQVGITRGGGAVRALTHIATDGKDGIEVLFYAGAGVISNRRKRLIVS